MSMHGVPSEGEWGSLAVPSVLAAAHELKVPLTLIRQLSYQLEDSGSLSQQQKLIGERIRLTSERALRLVENVTKVGRLDEAMFTLEPLQVGSVWSDVVREISPLADGLKQDVQLRISQKPLLVVAHRELLPAILMGLCDNALAHNPAGSALKLSAKRHKNNIVFSVRDNGPKIERNAFRNLAARLGTSPQPLGTRPNSSGLGLWIAGRFASAMDARLSVTKHRQGGVTFSLHVPTSTQLSLL